MQGLGAPLGAVLAGSRAFIDEVWRWKQRLGGSLRQVGICAAASLYALDHNVDRLADDHANAQLLADGLGRIDGVTVLLPENNLVFFDASGAGLSNERLTAALREHGLLVSIMGGRLRACTHLDVTAAMIDDLLQIMSDVVQRHAGQAITQPAFTGLCSRPARSPYPIVLARTTVV